MVTFIIVTWVICTYFLIGYLWLCHLAYRAGADLYLPTSTVHNNLKRERGNIDSGDYLLHVVMCPISVIAFCIAAICDHVSFPKFAIKISPESFYEKGKIDNDIDIQAEKHLLGGKNDTHL